jgi:hypothetical protein
LGEKKKRGGSGVGGGREGCVERGEDAAKFLFKKTRRKKEERAD